jgi:hypothetical protein
MRLRCLLPMTCRNLTIVLCLVTGMLVCVKAMGQTGQTSQAVDRSQIFRSEPSIIPGEPISQSSSAFGYAAPSANDADLGVQAILKRQEQYQPFSFSVSLPYYWTSNVALVRTGEVSDGVLAPAFVFAYQPRLMKTLYGEFIASQQLFYYNTYGSFNFTSFDAIAGVVYYLPDYHNLTLRLRYDYNRLTTDEWDQFFANHSIVASADMPFRFGRAMQLNLGALANVSVAANPSEPQRSDFEVYGGYHVQFSRSFSMDAVGRILFKEYYEGGRSDVSELLSVTADYRVREWLTLTAVSTFAWNQSNHSVFDYSVVNLGGALALTFKF